MTQQSLKLVLRQVMLIILALLGMSLLSSLPVQHVQKPTELMQNNNLLAGMAQAAEVTTNPSVTTTLTLEWLPDPDTPPQPIVDGSGVLVSPPAEAPIQTASTFFDDDDFFHDGDIGLRTKSLGAPAFPPDYTDLELTIGANGAAFCPKNSFGRTHCRARDGSRSSSGGGGNLSDAAKKLIRLLQRKSTLDEISTGAFGRPPADDAERQLLANLLKPFPAPTAGRTPLPRASAPQFGNVFNAGVTPHQSTVMPLNQAILKASSLPASLLGPQFRNQLDSYFNWPGAATQPLSGPALTRPPASAPPNAPCYTPSSPLTYATFVNESNRYVLITWLNFSCNEVKHAIVPPRRVYYQQSYFNYRWGVRDAQTLQFIGQVSPTLNNPRPVFRIFNTFSAQANGLGSMNGSLSSQQNYLTNLADLQDQFRHIGEQQVALFYNNDQLAALRAERVRLTYYFMYTDPVLIYVEHELGEIYRQIYTSRPSYNYVVSLATAIDSWTAPPGSSNVAKTRFIQRQSLALWQDQLENEVALFLQNNPTLAEQLAQVELWLVQRYTAIMQSNTVTTTAQDWLQRYADAYNTALDPLRTEARQFMADNPKFKEYVQLRDQIAELLPQFESHPLLDQLALKKAALEDDPSVIQTVNQAYSQYLSQISTALDQTTFDEESESFYAQLNNMVKSDPAYQQLISNYTNALQALQNYLQNVHAAVATCYAWYGSNCNPYTDPNVQAVLNHTRLWQLLAPLAAAHDTHSRYWYHFYQSQNYKNLQATAQIRMQAAQAPVLSTFDAARQQFEQQVKAIQQVQQFETALDNAVNVFRGGIQTNALATAGYPSAELDRKLKRLEQLELELLGRGNNTVYLPLIMRHR